jgi:hypothetical protein
MGIVRAALLVNGRRVRGASVPHVHAVLVHLRL